MESEKQQTMLKPAKPQQLSDLQLLEQMKERVRWLEQEAQKQEQQQLQIAMGHDTGRYGQHDELVQLQETQREEQQQTQMTTGQGTHALEFFESSSERLLSGLQKTTVMYCEDGESNSSLRLWFSLANSPIVNSIFGEYLNFFAVHYWLKNHDLVVESRKLLIVNSPIVQ